MAPGSAATACSSARLSAWAGSAAGRPSPPSSWRDTSACSAGSAGRCTASARPARPSRRWRSCPGVSERSGLSGWTTTASASRPRVMSSAPMSSPSTETRRSPAAPESESAGSSRNSSRAPAGVRATSSGTVGSGRRASFRPSARRKAWTSSTIRSGPSSAAPCSVRVAGRPAAGGGASSVASAWVTSAAPAPARTPDCDADSPRPDRKKPAVATSATPTTGTSQRAAPAGEDSTAASTGSSAAPHSGQRSSGVFSGSSAREAALLQAAGRLVQTARLIGGIPDGSASSPRGRLRSSRD